MADDSSESIANRHQLQRSSIVSLSIYDGRRQIGRIETASIGKQAVAFATDGKRLGEFPHETAAMRAMTDSAKAKERRA